MSESSKSSHTPSTFAGAIDVVSNIVSPQLIGEFGAPEGTGTLGWDGSIRRLKLVPEVAALAHLSNTVRARVIGDSDTGIAIVVRSRNLFNISRYGFYLQRGQDSNDGGFEAWHGPASIPQRGNVYDGHELLNRHEAQQCSPEVAQGIIISLQQSS